MVVHGCTVQAGKMLIVPTPKLRTGLLNHIKPPADAGVALLKACATRQVCLIFCVNQCCYAFASIVASGQRHYVFIAFVRASMHESRTNIVSEILSEWVSEWVEFNVQPDTV